MKIPILFSSSREPKYRFSYAIGCYPTLGNPQLTKSPLSELYVPSIKEKLKEPDDKLNSFEKTLLNRLFKDMGIILRKGYNSSTFLPQVWEKLKDPKEFLEHLSQKAGLDKDAWKTADIYYYMVNVEEE